MQLKVVAIDLQADIGPKSAPANNDLYKSFRDVVGWAHGTRLDVAGDVTWKVLDILYLIWYKPV
jgi:hypothetical protein